MNTSSNHSILHSLTDACNNNDGRNSLQTVIQVLPQIIFTYDQITNVLHLCNENRLVSQLGYNYNDVESWDNNILHLLYHDDLQTGAKEIAKIFGLPDNTSHSFDCRVNHKSGQYSYMKFSGAVVNRDTEGKAVSVVFTIEDNTEMINLKKKIESLQLHDPEDMFSYKEMITEREYFLNQGSWETNLQTGETKWSRGMYLIFGYETDKEIQDIQVTNVLHLSHMSEEEATKSKEDWNQVLKEKDNYVREAAIVTRNGKHKYVETYGKIIRNKLGIAEKIIGTTRDVTSLKEYKNSLEEKISELNHKNTDLEGFAYNASHDLQEPLRKLTAFSERLQTKFKQQLGEEGQMYLNRIVASAENMRTLIDNLLEFSRTAKSNHHFSKHDMTELLEEAKSDLELKIEESGTLIHASPLPVLEVIPSQIKQLFNNLLSNSIKFRIADTPPVIHISCVKLDNADKTSYNLKTGKEYYQLFIADNGIGFEPEYSEKIFQIFQRLHGKHEYPGSGIGLAICKKIIENHTGIIYAHAELNSGSVFTVILPENQL